LLDLAQLMLVKKSCQCRSAFRAETLLCVSLPGAGHGGEGERGVAAALGQLRSASRASSLPGQQNSNAAADSR